ETFYYVYDENGNLIEKGNDFIENVDGTVIFVTDAYKEYWQYEYTIKNRLKEVYFNEELQAEFAYDTDGMRIRSGAKDEPVTHYVYNQAGKVLFEVYDPVLDETQAENNQTEVSYIYAYGRQIAKVEGIIGNSEEIVYYHHDNLGSTRLMTDKNGLVIWEQDYMPFGEDLHKPGTSVFEYEEEVEYKYTGQRQVKGIGLYYYGARYYDPEIGRFISEDIYRGEISNSQSQNIFIYVMNNPMRYVDPTGNNAIIKSINSFKEIGIGLWNGLKYRTEHSFDSSYDFFNYCTIGILDATWSGAKERASKMTDSPYDFVNWLSFDTVGIFKGALFPEERFSADHWMNSIGAAGMLISGMDLLNRSAGSGLLDDGFINKAMKEVDEVVEGAGEADFYVTPEGLALNPEQYEIVKTFDDLIAQGKTPAKASLSDLDARTWYIHDEQKILSNINTTQSLERQAMQAFQMRNNLRTLTRELMSNRELADFLMKNEPNMTWQQIVSKYQSRGYYGDSLLKKIIGSSKKSRPSVNGKLYKK
ncbi:MAG: hypothetical protein KAX49_20765, partial [Halanaerobiales bacterium]|nr:hypothetical protein [Halanaerobiales bacterium]